MISNLNFLGLTEKTLNQQVMNLNCFKEKVIIILLVLVFIITMGFNSNIPEFFNKYDFSGTNSLFIEKINGLKFYWITNKKDIGVYELISSDNSIILKGNTDSGRVHSVFIDYKIKENVIFRFGGQNESISQVKLRSKSHHSISIFKNVDSIYVVGDVHGRYDQLINLLEKSHIINKELNWIAGNSSLVFLGDLFDRGNDVTKVLWFIYELEEKAEIAGGKVHLVLGNHEIMIMSKDLRYLGNKESAIAGAYHLKYDYFFHPKTSFLGSWLSSKPSVLKIGNNLFAHGGIVDLGTSSIKEFNQTVKSYLQDPIFLEIMEVKPDSSKYDPQAWINMKYFFYNDESPFWYRGYVYYDTLGPQLNSMLRKYKSKTHIVAHTPLEAITKRYKGKLLTTDLNEAATQLLLLVRNKRKYSAYKIDSSGLISELK